MQAPTGALVAVIYEPLLQDSRRPCFVFERWTPCAAGPDRRCRCSLSTLALHPPPSQTKYYMVNIYRGGMYILAVLAGEMPPLFVLEFLHRIYDIFVEYFGEVSGRVLTDHFSSAYQLLEEMLDNGHPMITGA